MFSALSKALLCNNAMNIESIKCDADFYFCNEILFSGILGP